jgi:hypothetical protein
MFPEHRGQTFQQRSIYLFPPLSSANRSGKMQDAEMAVHAKCTKSKI